MEREESVIQEFRLGDVTVIFGRYEAADGRKWPTFKVGRYYIKDAKENLISGLRVDDMPAAREMLRDAYKWAKQNPRALKNGTEE